MSPARRSRQPHLVALPSSAGAPEVRLSDAELIEAVVAGDASVASELYDRLVRRIDQTLYRVLGARGADHEDLIQSAFEQVVKTLTTRRFAGACSLETWGSSVATHVGLNALRSRQRERKVFDKTAEAPESSSAAPDPERQASLAAELERARAALSAMNAGRAEAVFLHDVLGHDLAEIAALTGVSIAAAQSRLVRGRKDLHQRLRVGKGAP